MVAQRGTQAAPIVDSTTTANTSQTNATGSAIRERAVTNYWKRLVISEGRSGLGWAANGRRDDEVTSFSQVASGTSVCVQQFATCGFSAEHSVGVHIISSVLDAERQDRKPMVFRSFTSELAKGFACACRETRSAVSKTLSQCNDGQSRCAVRQQMVSDAQVNANDVKFRTGNTGCTSRK